MSPRPSIEPRNDWNLFYLALGNRPHEEGGNFPKCPTWSHFWLCSDFVNGLNTGTPHLNKQLETAWIQFWTLWPGTRPVSWSWWLNLPINILGSKSSNGRFSWNWVLRVDSNPLEEMIWMKISRATEGRLCQDTVRGQQLTSQEERHWGPWNQLILWPQTSGLQNGRKKSLWFSS